MGKKLVARPLHDVTEKITFDKCHANTAAAASIQADSGLTIEMRQSKHLNNIGEQDQRAVKRNTQPMLGSKTSGCAGILIARIEVMRMIRKGQLSEIKDLAWSAADSFYPLAI